VRPAKAGVFSRSKAYRGKSQVPVVWIAEVMETETLKPIDKVFLGKIYESPGRNNSKCAGRNRQGVCGESPLR